MRQGGNYHLQGKLLLDLGKLVVAGIIIGGVLFIGLPFIIAGCVISWREHQSKKLIEQ